MNDTLVDPFRLQQLTTLADLLEWVSSISKTIIIIEFQLIVRFMSILYVISDQFFLVFSNRIFNRFKIYGIEKAMGELCHHWSSDSYDQSQHVWIE